MLQDRIRDVEKEPGLNGLGVDFSTTKTLTFESIGDSEHWFTYKKLGMLPWEEIQKVIRSKKMAQQKVSINTTEQKSIAEFITDTDAAFELSMDLIESWNLTDSEGNILEVPAKDPSSRNKVKGIWLIEMHNAITNDPMGLGFLNRT